MSDEEDIGSKQVAGVNIVETKRFVVTVVSWRYPFWFWPAESGDMTDMTETAYDTSSLEDGDKEIFLAQQARQLHLELKRERFGIWIPSSYLSFCSFLRLEEKIKWKKALYYTALQNPKLRIERSFRRTACEPKIWVFWILTVIIVTSS